jgi:hypothetical protein
MSDVHSAHFVRIRYLGPTDTRGSRLSLSWEGWPSDNSRPVRRAMDYTADRDQMARDAAKLFCDWLTAGDTGLTYGPRRITLAPMDGRDWALLVETQAARLQA